MWAPNIRYSCSVGQAHLPPGGLFQPPFCSNCCVNRPMWHLSQGEVQKEGLALQEGMQKEGFALQADSTKPDKPTPKDKVKSERQASLEKSKQVKTAKNEQNKKDKEQRQKQKDQEKEGGYLGNLTHNPEAGLSLSLSCLVNTFVVLIQYTAVHSMFAFLVRAYFSILQRADSILVANILAALWSTAGSCMPPKRFVHPSSLWLLLYSC